MIQKISQPTTDTGLPERVSEKESDLSAGTNAVENFASLLASPSTVVQLQSQNAKTTEDNVDTLPKQELPLNSKTFTSPTYQSSKNILDQSVSGRIVQSPSEVQLAALQASHQASPVTSSLTAPAATSVVPLAENSISKSPSKGIEEKTKISKNLQKISQIKPELTESPAEIIQNQIPANQIINAQRTQNITSHLAAPSGLSQSTVAASGKPISKFRSVEEVPQQSTQAMPSFLESDHSDLDFVKKIINQNGIIDSAERVSVSQKSNLIESPIVNLENIQGPKIPVGLDTQSYMAAKAKPILKNNYQPIPESALVYGATAQALSGKLRNEAPIKMELKVVPGSLARPQITKDSIVQMTQGLDRMIRDGIGEMNIRLKPDNLGELQLRVLTDGNKVALKIKASDAGAKRVLEESLSNLTEVMASKDLILKSVDIGLMSSPKENLQTLAQRDGGSSLDLRNLTQSDRPTKDWLLEGHDRDSKRSRDFYDQYDSERENRPRLNVVA